MTKVRLAYSVYDVRSGISHNHRNLKLPSLSDELEDFLANNSFHSSLVDIYGYNAIRLIFARFIYKTEVLISIGTVYRFNYYPEHWLYTRLQSRLNDRSYNELIPSNVRINNSQEPSISVPETSDTIKIEIITGSLSAVLFFVSDD